MSESNTPEQAKQRSRRSKRKGVTDEKSPCRDTEQGKECTGNEPPERGPTAIPPGMPSPHREESQEDARAGSKEKAPGEPPSRNP